MEDRPEPRRRLLPLADERVRVDLQQHHHAVPERRRHDVRRHALLKRQRRDRVPTAVELLRAPRQSSSITRPNYKHGVAQQVGSLSGLQLTSKRETIGVTISTDRCAPTHFIYASLLAAELAVGAVFEPRQHLALGGGEVDVVGEFGNEAAVGRHVLEAALKGRGLTSHSIRSRQTDLGRPANSNSA